MKTKRAQRIQATSVTLWFRHPDTGAVFDAEVWREDILEWQPDTNRPSEFYLVLDFGLEEALIARPSEAPAYESTGRIQLDLQPIDVESPDEWDLRTGLGLGPAVARFADVPTERVGDQPNADPMVGRPMTGWIPHPVSPRRAIPKPDA